MKITAPGSFEAHPAPNLHDDRSARPSFKQISSEESDESSSRLESFHFHSAILPDDRRICIHLPPQYAADTTRHFPTFYLHDGQNLFDPRTSYVPGHTWRAGATADQMNKMKLAAPVILVGIANTGLRRMNEYTPTADYKMGGGEGDRYGRLITEELIPFIGRTYRTSSRPEDTGLGGSSLGGLISLYLGLQYPQIFGRLAVLSPSIWWDQRSILKFVQNLSLDGKQLPRIWVDIGTAEGQRHVRDAELLARMLQRKGWDPGTNLRFLEVAGGLHSEDAWADRFDQILSFLFPPSI